MSSGEPLLAVVATPEPLPLLVDRLHWPIHITIVGNFHVEQDASLQIPALLAEVARRLSAFQVALGPADRFGTNGEIPVLLARHAELDSIHARLAASLMELRNFEAQEPHYWLEGYRPHATLGRAVRAHEGQRLWIRDLSLVLLQEGKGVCLASVNLPRSGAGDTEAVIAPPLT